MTTITNLKRALVYPGVKAVRPAKDAIWIQETGWVKGCDAREAQPGMKMVYNGGECLEILRVEPSGKSSALITVSNNGKEWTRKRRGLIPCQE